MTDSCIRELTCVRRPSKKDGIMRLYWQTGFRVSVAEQEGKYTVTDDSSLKETHQLMKRLMSALSKFEKWLQNEPPVVGTVASIILCPDDTGDDKGYGLSRIFQSLKDSYRALHPRDWSVMRNLTLAYQLKDLANKPNVLDIRGERIMPQAMTLLFSKEARRGLWLYRQKDNAMRYSRDAKTHFQFDDFPAIKDIRGWVRGGVFEKNGLTYILIQTGDFFDGVIPGKVFEDMCLLAESMSRKMIFGVVDETGVDLLAGKDDFKKGAVK